MNILIKSTLVLTTLLTFILSSIPSSADRGITIKPFYPSVPKDGGKEWDVVGTPSRSFPSLYISTKFTSEERTTLSIAYVRVARLIVDNSISDCVKKYAGAQSDSIKMYPTRLYIEHFEEEPKDNTITNGHASVGFLKDRSYYLIGINVKALAPLERQDAVDKFSGTIFHEMLHNTGYTHDEYDPNTKGVNMRGNLVYESGWCVSRLGKDKEPGSLSLTGSSGSEFYVD
jgi:hypothetical protein